MRTGETIGSRPDAEMMGPLVGFLCLATFLGVSSAQGNRPSVGDFDNCKMLHESLRVAWTVNRTAETVRFMLCGCALTEVTTANQYMGFGLSGSTSQTLMRGADATIAWVDDTTGAQAVDYFLSDYVQCRGGVGACPDEMDSSGSCTNDVSDVSGWKENGQQCVVFTRRFATADSTCDITMNPDNRNQYIVWAVGGYGATAFKHFVRASMTESPLHLGRTPSNECSGMFRCSECPRFPAETIEALNDTTFVAQIGPTGLARGYMAITGSAGWGIAWYLNGSLIPELIVQRNQTYTFIVEGGNDPSPLQRANYHPFYITDSASGGRLLNSASQRARERVFAGFDNQDNPTGIGRLCQLDESPEATETLTNCGTREQYQQELTLSCRPGEPGMITWTPDDNTPNTVYYQCASHLSLGWRITVMPTIATATMETSTTMETTAGSVVTMATLELTLLATVLGTLLL